MGIDGRRGCMTNMTRECWVIEEQDKETGAWFSTDTCYSEAHALEVLRRWYSHCEHRVVRYVPAPEA